MEDFLLFEAAEMPTAVEGYEYTLVYGFGSRM